MTKKPDDKGMLNELLPDPTRTAAELSEGTPRSRTVDHLKRILAAGLTLQLAGDVASCGSAPGDTQKPKEPAPSSYGVVDPIPPPFIKRSEAPGFLTLKSTPSADITVDGTPTGLMTPQNKIELSPGIHTIGLTAPGRKKPERSFSVEIVSGETRSEVHDLRPAKPATRKK